jgi:hypothetical protein
MTLRTHKTGRICGRCKTEIEEVWEKNPHIDDYVETCKCNYEEEEETI